MTWLMFSLCGCSASIAAPFFFDPRLLPVLIALLAVVVPGIADDWRLKQPPQLQELKTFSWARSIADGSIQRNRPPFLKTQASCASLFPTWWPNPNLCKFEAFVKVWKFLPCLESQASLKRVSEYTLVFKAKYCLWLAYYSIACPRSCSEILMASLMMSRRSDWQSSWSSVFANQHGCTYGRIRGFLCHVGVVQKNLQCKFPWDVLIKSLDGKLM